MGNNSTEWLNSKFGRLTVIDFAHAEAPARGWNWVCRCECGVVKVLRPFEVKSGKIRSCGCLHDEVCAQKATKFVNRTIDNKRLYSIYNGIKKRCYRVAEPRYKDYGARGIRLADEWLDEQHGFDNFVKWSMNNGYTEDMTIDRIDVDGNYDPNNCRWVSLSEQALNKRETLWVDYKGERVQLLVLCKQTGTNYDTVHNRIYCLGWSVEDAINKPSQQCDSLRAKCHEKGISYSTVLSRIRKFGWSEEDALNTPSHGRGTKGKDFQ